MSENIIKLTKKQTPIYSKINPDEFISATELAFDCKLNGIIEFYPWELPINIPKNFKIGIIVGSSGSGKSTLLKEFGDEITPEWSKDKPIISHFNSPDDAINRLGSVGLNSIPSWTKPYHILSNGEKFRADLSRKLNSNSIIDEFTSLVDRTTAMSTSISISKYIKNNNLKNIIISTCHRDVLDWLEPDWIIDTDSGEYISDFFFVRKKFELKIYRTTHEFWGLFKNHHYLDGKINKASRCYIGILDNKIIAFGSSIAMPSGTIKNAWRGHRTVILPEYQGLGIGTRFSDAIAQIHLDEGHRYFSRTSHPRMGFYREHSPLWVGTSKNKKLRKDISINDMYKDHYYDNRRICFSHEYIGPS